MTTLPTGCSSERIQSFLSGTLAADEQTSFEDHLTHCGSCRVSLEDAAADPGFWNESQSQLAYWGEETDDLLRTTASNSAGNDLTHNPLAVLRGLLVPSDDPHSMGRLAAYEVMGLVGRGGMGIVVKALDPGLNRNVAIKILASDMAAHGAARQRFAREARAAAAVVHENVMAIHAVAEARGVPFLVMPYIRGGSLERRLQEQGPQPVDAIVRVGLQVAAGLAAAHGQGLVHRDIKPANILLEEGTERVRITDFGLARAADDASMTVTGVIAGTPQYMSPEQAGGEVIDPRSDLFSLGSVMYAMAAGRAPFRAETSLGVLRLIREQRTRPIRSINAAIPDWLADVIDTLHEKRPDNRYSSAAEVATLLRQCLAHLQQPLISPLPAALRYNWWRRRLLRRPSVIGVCAGVALASVVAAAVYRWPTVPASDRDVIGSERNSPGNSSGNSSAILQNGPASLERRSNGGDAVSPVAYDQDAIDSLKSDLPSSLINTPTLDTNRVAAPQDDMSAADRGEIDLDSAIDQKIANLNDGVDQLRLTFNELDHEAGTAALPTRVLQSKELPAEEPPTQSPPSKVLPTSIEKLPEPRVQQTEPEPFTYTDVPAPGAATGSDTTTDMEESVPPDVELPEEISTESSSDAS